MAEKNYFKLGKKAHVFFDPQSGVKIAGKQVVEIDKVPNSKIFREAKDAGHITAASKAEYDDFVGVGVEEEEVKNTGNEKAELLERVKLLDKKAFKDLKDKSIEDIQNWLTINEEE